MRNQPVDPFGHAAASGRVVILDGGLATELEARGHDLNDPLWSARLIADDPDAIRGVHADFLRAGADCITACTYQATIPGFVRRGHSADGAEALIRRAIELAVEARDAFWDNTANRVGRSQPLVAASVGPYGAFLADGSEYRGNYGLDEDALVAFHRRRWEILLESDADVLACETIPSFPEVRALLRLVGETPQRRAWMSVSCGDGERMWDGTPVAEVAAACDAVDGVAAVGLNCTAPVHVSPLIQRIRAVTSKPVIVYPNSGEEYDAVTKRWASRIESGSASDFTDAAESWVREGAVAVGGCCRIGPETISALRRRLRG